MVGVGITASLSALASSARAESSTIVAQRTRFDRAAELAEDGAQRFRVDAQRALESQRQFVAALAQLRSHIPTNLGLFRWMQRAVWGGVGPSRVGRVLSMLRSSIWLGIAV